MMKIQAREQSVNRLDNPPNSAHPSRPTILVIDDSPTSLQLLYNLLTRRGFLVRPVETGSMALSSALNNPPDLILLDIILPDMDGYEVCRQLKGNPQTREVPVIFLSALDDVLDKVKAFSIGGVDYISKPFEEAEVLVRIETHLAIRLLQKDLEEKNTLLEQEVAERKRTQEELQRMAITDPLTGLFNRRQFFHLAAIEFEKARRYKRPLSVILIDVDQFKGVNDRYGHAAGDLALVNLSNVMLVTVRSMDILARYGGEEFVVLLPETKLQSALVVAERIREQVERNSIRIDNQAIPMTISLGVADLMSCPDKCSFDQMLVYADDALYKAKDEGRNRVSSYQQENSA